MRFPCRFLVQGVARYEAESGTKFEPAKVGGGRPQLLLAHWWISIKPRALTNPRTQSTSNFIDRNPVFCLQVDVAQASNVLDRWISAASRNLTAYVRKVRALGGGAPGSKFFKVFQSSPPPGARPGGRGSRLGFKDAGLY